MSPKLEVFFSYAWDNGNQQGDSREKLVDQLYESLIRDHYNVIRDKYNIEYRGFFSEFMNKLGKGKCIVVAISRKYLRSPYCMFELYEIARHSGFDKHNFRDRILPIMVEFVNFDNPMVIEEYFSFWENEYKVWSNLVTTRAGQLAVEQLERFDKVKMIYQHFGKLMEWLADINTLNPKVLSDGNFAEIKRAIKKYEVKPNPGRFWVVTIAAIVVIMSIAAIMFRPPAPSDENAGSPAQEHLADIQDSTGARKRQPQEDEQQPSFANTGTHQTTKGSTGEGSGNNNGSGNQGVAVSYCKTTCDTKGIAGVSVSFKDPKRDTTYTLTSGNEDLIFSIPCDVLNETVRVTFRKGVTSEARNFKVKELSIPNLFLDE